MSWLASVDNASDDHGFPRTGRTVRPLEPPGAKWLRTKRPELRTYTAAMTQAGVSGARCVGFIVRHRDSVSDNVGRDLRQLPSQVVPNMVPNTSHSPASSCTPDASDLSLLVATWARLPDAIKAGIMAMVRTTLARSDAEDSTMPNG